MSWLARGPRTKPVLIVNSILALLIAARSVGQTPAVPALQTEAREPIPVDISFAFDPKLEYQVDSKDGDCSMELLGTPGTKFKLIQF